MMKFAEELEKRNATQEIAASDSDSGEENKAAKFKEKTNFQKLIELINTWEFFFEFLLLAVHPLPYYEKYFDFWIIDMLETKTVYKPVRYLLCEDFLFAFMCCRVYFVVRTIMNFSLFAELYSKKVCMKYGFK